MDSALLKETLAVEFSQKDGRRAEAETLAQLERKDLLEKRLISSVSKGSVLLYRPAGTDVLDARVRHPSIQDIPPNPPNPPEPTNHEQPLASLSPINSKKRAGNEGKEGKETSEAKTSTSISSPMSTKEIQGNFEIPYTLKEINSEDKLEQDFLGSSWDTESE